MSPPRRRGDDDPIRPIIVYRVVEPRELQFPGTEQGNAIAELELRVRALEVTEAERRGRESALEAQRDNWYKKWGFWVMFVTLLVAIAALWIAIRK